jgi:S-(hydroxymethyl)glutathione dehydrogenase/alcohol dehydrogenase
MSLFEGRPITCKAAVCWRAKEALVVEDVEVAPPKAGEVRVRITAAHVCHTDSLVLEGLDNEGVYPVILGHEGVDPI